MTALVLEAIRRHFRTMGRVARAVDGVDLAVHGGEILGLVGESGCGKTTLARIAVGLDQPDRGSVRLGDRPLLEAGKVDAGLRRRVQLVFQEPLASFNPRRTVGRSIGLPLRLLGQSAAAVGAQAQRLLEQVGLDPALGARRPHLLSGGQLQRAAIARALALEPEILVCDEPVASLDVSVRAQILNLLLDLRRDRGIGILFVSHDLGVVRAIADRVAVMYLGRIVETGPSEAVWSRPRHPYTRALAAAVPAGVGSWRQEAGRPRLAGEPPSPFAVPAGCRFHPRCPIAVDRCLIEDPALRPFPSGVSVACHRAEGA
ncbi:MAG: oligopeptide/dipeptide ABC transporter ATP-binding protein [Alphaproteobacteria bacterium]